MTLCFLLLLLQPTVPMVINNSLRTFKCSISNSTFYIVLGETTSFSFNLHLHTQFGKTPHNVHGLTEFVCCDSCFTLMTENIMKISENDCCEDCTNHWIGLRNSSLFNNSSVQSQLNIFLAGIMVHTSFLVKVWTTFWIRETI